jgi:hypothetical protein
MVHDKGGTEGAQEGAKKGTQADRRQHNKEVLNWLTREANENTRSGGVNPTTDPLPKAEQRCNADLRDSERWQNRRATITIIKSFSETDEDPIEMAEAGNLVESKRCMSRLRSKLDYLHQIAQTQPTHTNDGSIHITNTVTERDFTIDRGNNTSPRITNPFVEDRVEEIVQKIAIGPDLMDTQREEVRALVRKYADVFALSLSEVKVVDWYKHHLHIDTSVKLPKKTAQRPITEAQKDWFFSILDEMEDAHIIQKVPGDFIKALSSTNIQPKEAGKIRATRTEILRKVNAECIKNGLPSFWEEVREPSETDEAMLEAVENQGGVETKTKWRLCHAFTALNKAT